MQKDQKWKTTHNNEPQTDQCVRKSTKHTTDTIEKLGRCKNKNGTRSRERQMTKKRGKTPVLLSQEYRIIESSSKIAHSLYQDHNLNTAFYNRTLNERYILVTESQWKSTKDYKVDDKPPSLTLPFHLSFVKLPLGGQAKIYFPTC